MDSTDFDLREDALKACIDASRYPLSIVLVGLGDGPWEFFRLLDDQVHRRHFDNVTFLPLAETFATAKFPSYAFACAAMAQVPSQFEAAKRLGFVRKGFAEVVQDVVALNPGLKGEDLAPVGPAELDPVDESRVVGDLAWNGKGIGALPESIGDLIIEGDFRLEDNQLTELPEGFKRLSVENNVVIYGNPVAEFLRPGSPRAMQGFGNLTVVAGADCAGRRARRLEARQV